MYLASRVQYAGYRSFVSVRRTIAVYDVRQHIMFCLEYEYCQVILFFKRLQCRIYIIFYGNVLLAIHTANIKIHMKNFCYNKSNIKKNIRSHIQIKSMQKKVTTNTCNVGHISKAIIQPIPLTNKGITMLPICKVTDKQKQQIEKKICQNCTSSRTNALFVQIK